MSKILAIGENRCRWIDRTEFVQIAKSASQTFDQEIYEKEMHLVFLQILSLVNECQIHNKCGIVSNHPPHRAQCDEAIDLF